MITVNAECQRAYTAHSCNLCSYVLTQVNSTHIEGASGTREEKKNARNSDFSVFHVVASTTAWMCFFFCFSLHSIRMRARVCVSRESVCEPNTIPMHKMQSMDACVLEHNDHFVCAARLYTALMAAFTDRRRIGTPSPRMRLHSMWMCVSVCCVILTRFG